jgi:hypothetical protein
VPINTGEIIPAVLTVTAEDKSSQYSDPRLDFTAIFSGFVDDETFETSGVIGEPSYSTDPELSDPITQAAGIYYIIPGQGTLDADNYSFRFVNGEYTVTNEIIYIKYIGDTFKWVNKDEVTGNEDDKTSLNLKAILREDDDGNPGNLKGLEITFNLENLLGSESFKYSAEADSNGNIQFTSPAEIPAGLYEIIVRVVNNEYYTTAIDIRTISIPDWADRTSQVNGSGEIDGYDASFGFDVRYAKNSPTGFFNFYYLDGNYLYVIKNNSWAKGGLMFSDENSAYFESKATVKKFEITSGENF